MTGTYSGKVAYTNVRLLDPASDTDLKVGAAGGVLTLDGTIADVGPDIFADGLPGETDLVDGGGLCLAPGLVDMRVTIGEPGFEHRESIRTASLAAAAGGVTTIISTPETDPVIDEVALVDFVERRARATSLVSIDPMAAATKGLRGQEITEMGLLAEAGAVAFTDGHSPIVNAQIMRRALTYAKNFGVLIVQHIEEPSLSRGAMNAGALATRMGLPGIPPMAEVIMLERDLRLVEMTGGRYHATGVSTAESVSTLLRAKDRGLDVTCSIAPHHFALNENEVMDYRTFAKVSPPLRTEEDRLAMVDGLKHGIIDLITSDHMPCDTDTKRQPFELAASGAVGLETLLPVTLQLYHNGHMSLLDALRLVTDRPARLLDKRSGCLKRSAPADLILFDTDRAWQLDSDKLKSKSKNTPFDRKPMQGRVMRTVVAGKTVFEMS